MRNLFQQVKVKQNLRMHGILGLRNSYSFRFLFDSTCKQNRRTRTLPTSMWIRIMRALFSVGVFLRKSPAARVVARINLYALNFTFDALGCREWASCDQPTSRWGVDRGSRLALEYDPFARFAVDGPQVLRRIVNAHTGEQDCRI
jgi:hypothetical protein